MLNPYRVFQDTGGRGSGGSSPTASGGAGRRGERGGERAERGGERAERGGERGAAGGDAGADWVRRERLGKKGEFRYF